MRFALAAVSGAALTGAVVIPGFPATLYPQAPLSGSRPADRIDANNDAFWRDGVPSEDVVTSSLRNTAGRLTAAIENAIDAVEDARHELADKAAHISDNGHEKHPRLTIYELIQRSEHTTKFAKIVDEYPGIVKLLNSTAANYTLFAPTDEAFKDLPDGDDGKPHKEFVEAVLKYHIGLGEYPARRILSTHTIPTALNEELLGGEPQRLRTSIGLGGVSVNFYSKVVAANIVRSAPSPISS